MATGLKGGGKEPKIKKRSGSKKREKYPKIKYMKN